MHAPALKATAAHCTAVVEPASLGDCHKEISEAASRTQSNTLPMERSLIANEDSEDVDATSLPDSEELDTAWTDDGSCSGGSFWSGPRDSRPTSSLSHRSWASQQRRWTDAEVPFYHAPTGFEISQAADSKSSATLMRRLPVGRPRTDRWLMWLGVCCAAMASLGMICVVGHLVWRMMAGLERPLRDSRFGSRVHAATRWHSPHTKPPVVNETVTASLLEEAEPAEPWPAHNGAILVALVAEGKSGSTILGELFNQRNDTWYLFEPLRNLMANPGDALMRLYHQCQWSADFARQVFWGYGSQKNRWYRETVREHPSRVDWQHRRHHSPLHGSEDLLQQVADQCLRARVRAMKFIRLADFTHLLPALVRHRYSCPSQVQLSDGNNGSSSGSVPPELCHPVRIVHIVRDPRAILASRLAKKWVPADPTSFRHEARQLCRRMQAKDQQSHGLHQAGVYHRVQYEDWVRDPHDVARRLYAFVGFEPSDYGRELRRRMKSLMRHDAHRKRSPMNLTATLDRWRHELTADQLAIIDEECGPWR